MIFSNFRFNVALRLVILLLLGFTAIFIWLYTHFWLVSFWLLLFVILLSVNLINYVEKSDRELILFLEALKQKDFTVSFNKKENSSERLHKAYNAIIDALHQLSLEKEANHLYLQAIVDHANMALICFDSSGNIVLSNAAARKLIDKPSISNIRGIKIYNPVLGRALGSLEAGKAQLLRYDRKGAQVALSIQSSQFILKEGEYTIVTFRDIHNELEQQEADSWQKLIRVLTHEIMNSAIPLSNLSQIINEMVHNKMVMGGASPVFSSEELNDLSYSLERIEKRSRGLVHFVSGYKKFTELPQPKFQQINVHDLISGVERLMSHEFMKMNVTTSICCHSDGLKVLGDLELLEQVLLNTLQNAVEALQEASEPEIKIEMEVHGNQVLIHIQDNGPGIDDDILDHIFIPFFTTKPKGSGIGLSISKKIMRLHDGNLYVSSQKGAGTVFTMELKRPL